MVEHVFDSIPDNNVPCLVALPAGERLPPRHDAQQRTHTVHIGKTRGQADTLRQMVRWLPRMTLDKTAIVIVNCDVVFLNSDRISWLIRQIQAGFAVSNLVVRSDSPAMSYAYPYPCPQKFVEKEVLGHHAMAGAWAFSNASRLLNALDWACCQGDTEPYLSHAMGRISGPKISQEIEAGEMVDLGTPKAVKTAGATIFS